MSTQLTPSGGLRGAQELLNLATAQARALERDDLVRRLTDARRLLVDPTSRILVTGAPGQGKSALIEALSLTDAPPPPGSAHSGAARSSDYLEVSPSAEPGPETPRAHAVLFVSDARCALTAAELDALRELQDAGPPTVLVVTMIDLNPDWPAVVEHNEALLRDAGLAVDVVAVSAGWRMRGEWTRDDHMIAHSRVHSLRQEVDRLSSDLERLRSAAHQTLATVSALEQMQLDRRAHLQQPGLPEHAACEAQQVQERVDALKSVLARWQTVLNSGVTVLQSDANLDIRQRNQAVGLELERALEDAPSVAAEWPDLCRWLHQRLLHDELQVRSAVSAAGQGISLRIAETFALSRPYVLDPAVVHAPVELPAPPAAAGVLSGVRTFTTAAAVGIMMRAWAGFVMYFVLHSIAKLTLPLWVGILPMLVMGLIAAGEERRKGLDRRRNQANRALRTYINDAGAHTTRNITALVRHIELELREAYRAHAEQEQKVLEAASAETKRTLRDLDRLPKQLNEIEHRLMQFAELRKKASALVPSHLLAGAERGAGHR